MEFLSRFRKKEEPQPDSPEVGLEKWNQLKAKIESLQKLDYKLTLKTTVLMPDGTEYTYPPGLELVVKPAYTSEASSPGEKPLHYPKQINIFVPQVVRNQAGILEEQRILLYHAEPESQQFFDYTDVSLRPSGKTVKDTNTDGFIYISGLIQHFSSGEKSN